jgi:hypothetical protein
MFYKPRMASCSPLLLFYMKFLQYLSKFHVIQNFELTVFTFPLDVMKKNVVLNFGIGR